MGLAPLLVERIFDALAALKAAGTTILLAEQNARLALRLCDWAYILELGHVVEHGSAAELSGSARMEEIYLGG
jgi:branched-chain amino acid transport system ATP-binding protein